MSYAWYIEGVLILLIITTIFFHWWGDKPHKKPKMTFPYIVKIDTPTTCGTGIIIKRKQIVDHFTYFVISPTHLLKDKEDIYKLSIYNHNFKKIEDVTGELVTTNFYDDLDLGVIKFESVLNIQPITILNKPRLESLNILDETYLISCQLCNNPSVLQGNIVQFYVRNDVDFIMSDNGVSPGSSGGALVINVNGEPYLIGMTIGSRMYHIPIEHLGIFVSANSFVGIIDKL